MAGEPRVDSGDIRDSTDFGEFEPGGHWEAAVREGSGADEQRHKRVQERGGEDVEGAIIRREELRQRVVGMIYDRNAWLIVWKGGE